MNIDACKKGRNRDIVLERNALGRCVYRAFAQSAFAVCALLATSRHHLQEVTNCKDQLQDIATYCKSSLADAHVPPRAGYGSPRGATTDEGTGCG
jgi:hypothetical protein